MRFVIALCLVACLAQASEASCRLGKLRIFRLCGSRSVSSCQTVAVQPVRQAVVTTPSGCVECQKLAK